MAGIAPTATRQCEPAIFAPVGEGRDHPVLGALDGVGAGAVEHVHAAALEHVLEDGRRVLVLAGQHLVPGGHEGDLGPEAPVGRGELRAGHAGADHDHVLGDLGEVVDLLPVEDPLPVRLRGGQLAREGADGEQHGLRVEGVLQPVLAGDLHAGGAQQPAGARDHLHPHPLEPALDVPGLGRREAQQTGVDLLQVHAEVVDLVAVHAAAAHVHPEVRGLGEAGHGVGGGDERLGGDDVRQHRRPAQALLLDDGHVRAEAGRDEGGLVAARTAADDDELLDGEFAVCSHPGHSCRCRCARGTGPAAPRRSGPCGSLWRVDTEHSTDRDDPFELAQEAADALRRATGVDTHEIALTLGSGWGQAAELIGETVAEVPAAEIPGFTRPPSRATSARCAPCAPPRAGTRW